MRLTSWGQFRVGNGGSGHRRCNVGVVPIGLTTAAALALIGLCMAAAPRPAGATTAAAASGGAVDAGASTLTVPADPGAPGPLDTARVEYDLGDTALTNPVIGGTNELRGVVHFPTAAATGKYPLVLFLHGRHQACRDAAGEWPCTKGEIPSFEGYDYLAKHLASRGFVVVSVGANGIGVSDSTGDYGMAARAHVIRKNLELLRGWAAGAAGSPIPSAALQSIDFGTLGLVGHSRGGEGIMTYAEELADHPGDLAPKLLLPLAPVDFNRPSVRGITTGLITPECDHDVTDIQGVHYFDDHRLADTANRYWVSVDRANHNYFNTVWSPSSGLPGSGDDFESVDKTRNQGYCDPKSGTRLTEVAQRDVGTRWVTAMAESALVGSTTATRILEAADPMPGVDPKQFVASWMPPEGRRLLINSHDGPTRRTVGESGAALSAENGATALDCGNFRSTSWACTGGAVGPVVHSSASEPHLTPQIDPSTAQYLHSEALGQTMLRWKTDRPLSNTNEPLLRSTMPGGSVNVSQYESLRWRMTTAISFENDFDEGQSGSIRVRDTGGKAFEFDVDAANPLYLRYPPQTSSQNEPGLVNNVTHMLVRQVRVPVADIAGSGVDVSSIAAIEFVPDRETSGEVTFADLLFVDETPPDVVPPTTTTTTTTATTTSTTTPTTSTSSPTTSTIERPTPTTVASGPPRRPVFTG